MQVFVEKEKKHLKLVRVPMPGDSVHCSKCGGTHPMFGSELEGKPVEGVLFFECSGGTYVGWDPANGFREGASPNPDP